jgi:hypothetical protein
MGPGGPARQRGSAGSTTNRRPDLERGPSRASVHTEAWARRTARAPARRHATAARCRLAAMKNSFQRSVQWSPAMHREQPVGGLRGGSARRASGVGKHLIRRRSKLERPAERRQDGAEGLQPLGPSAGRAPASTPTQSVDGRCLARLGQGSCARTRPQCSSELPAARSGQLGVRPAPSVSVESAAATARASLNSRRICERFVAVSSEPHGRGSSVMR